MNSTALLSFNWTFGAPFKSRTSPSSDQELALLLVFLERIASFSKTCQIIPSKVGFSAVYSLSFERKYHGNQRGMKKNLCGKASPILFPAV